jgi:alpha-galactosidase
MFTRAVVAMSGTFGYELDPAKLSDEEKSQIRDQIADFKRYYDLIQSGEYYRLTEIGDNYFEAWEFAASDASEALLNVVVTDIQPNPTLMNIRLKGLDPDAVYEMTEKKYANENVPPEFSTDSVRKRELRGDALMNAGYTLEWAFGDYPALQIHLRRL